MRFYLESGFRAYGSATTLLILVVYLIYENIAADYGNLKPGEPAGDAASSTDEFESEPHSKFN